jgi:DNA modification methylase
MKPGDSIPAELIGNVQFLYEVNFARLELEAFGVNYNMNLESETPFELIPPFNEDLLLERLAHFERVGQKVTDYCKIVSRNATRSENQYLTHWYYPYKGKFHPRLVRAIFNIMKLQRGQTVLDPFVGSGTTTLEAYLIGINSIGFDILPTCIIQSKVKISAGDVAEMIPIYRDKAILNMRKKYDAKRVAKSTSTTKDRGRQKKDSYEGFLSSIEDERAKDFYRLAQLIFASDVGRRHRDFSAFEKNLDRMILSARYLAETKKDLSGKLGKTQLRIGDARSLPMEPESVDGIVTSPPYSIALDYVKNDLYALQELDENLEALRDRCIGVRGRGEAKLQAYKEDMQKCYKEMHRVLKPGGQCVIVIGEAVYNGEDTTTVTEAIDFCQSLGFSLIRNIPKKIFGLYNTIKDERVLFFEK